jgi:hypothetical protein
MGEVKIVQERIRFIVNEHNFDDAMEIAEGLRAEGYEILSGPRETYIPQGVNDDGTPRMVPGYEVVVDDGTPRYAL